MINFAEYFDEYSDKLDWKELEKVLISSLSQEIEANTNRIGNKLEATETTQTIVKKSLKSFYSSKAYKNSLLKLVAEIDKKTSQSIGEYNKIGLKINKPLTLALDEHLSGLNESGLNERFNQPLRRLIFDNIRRGIGQRELESNLSKYLKDDKTGLQRYGKNMAVQAASAYSNTLDQAIVNKYKADIKGFAIIGSLIETSSPQCRKHVELGRKLSIATIKKKVLPLAIEEGAKDSDFDVYNLPNELWHYGCRHRFVPLMTESGLK